MKSRTCCTNRVLSAVLVTGFLAVAVPAWGWGGQVINEDFKVLASEGEAGDYFGWSIALDNGVVAVGAIWDDDQGFNSGSAYLFEASTGAQIAKLVPGDGASWDQFGFSIAINNGIVAVGAVWDDDNGSESGSVYLFEAITGTQIAKLIPGDGAGWDQFGFSIAMDNGVVAVGAWGDDDNGSESGSAYLFEAITGAQIAKLVPGDGAAGDQFGFSIAMDNGIVAVGARYADDNGGLSGSAYLFDVSTGAQLAKLLPSDGEAGDWFGRSIAIDNGIVGVGATGDDDNGFRAGSVYLFNASTGAQIAKFLPSDGTADNRFGESIAIDNGIVAVGAYLDDDNGRSSGSAYSFNALTGAQIAKLLPSDGATEVYFGRSIAIDSGVAFVGAIGDGAESGSVYVFDVCPADFNGDGTVNTLDFIAYLNAFSEGDPIADMNGDGVVNTLDFLAFLNLFSEGC